MPDELTKREVDYDREQVQLIKDSVAKGATDLELRLFLYQCKKTGLDPLSRQIHFIKRWSTRLQKEEGTIQTGIDGYRAIADRTGQYAGSDDATFQYSEFDHPDSATVTVWKLVGGQRCSFTATAHWTEYFPSQEKQQFFWNKMPHGQLSKCAEALALRKAFPQQLSGVYTNEEMQQAGPEFVQIGDKVVESNTKEAAQEVSKQKIAGLQAHTDAKLEGKITPPGKSAEDFVKEKGFALSEPKSKEPPLHTNVEGVVGELSKEGMSPNKRPFCTAMVGKTLVSLWGHDTELQRGVKNLKGMAIVLDCVEKTIGGKVYYDAKEILGSSGAGADLSPATEVVDDGQEPF
jgi:phage recombination protein Bet